MKRKILFVGLLAVCFVLLTGCGCQHEWKEADCLAPKTCALCGETEGEVVGHSWQEATCTAPKTCSVCKTTEGVPLTHIWVEATCSAPKTCSLCASTEGDPLDHAFDLWQVNGESMSRTCRDCGAEETTETDREVIARSCLAGRWYCTSVIMGDFEQDAMYVFRGPAPFLEVSEDSSVLYFNSEETFEGTLKLANYIPEEARDRYALLVMAGENPALMVVLDVTPEGSKVSILETLATMEFDRETEEEAIMRKYLAGTLKAREKRVEGDVSAYTDCRITFRDDGGFEAEKDGISFEGKWVADGMDEYQDGVIYTYRIIYAENNRRKEHFLQCIEYHDGTSRYSINFSNEYELYFTRE